MILSRVGLASPYMRRGERLTVAVTSVAGRQGGGARGFASSEQQATSIVQAPEPSGGGSYYAGSLILRGPYRDVIF